MSTEEYRLSELTTQAKLAETVKSCTDFEDVFNTLGLTPNEIGDLGCLFFDEGVRASHFGPKPYLLAGKDGHDHDQEAHYDTLGTVRIIGFPEEQRGKLRPRQTYVIKRRRFFELLFKETRKLDGLEEALGAFNACEDTSEVEKLYFEDEGTVSYTWTSSSQRRKEVATDHLLSMHPDAFEAHTLEPGQAVAFWENAVLHFGRNRYGRLTRDEKLEYRDTHGDTFIALLSPNGGKWKMSRRK